MNERKRICVLGNCVAYRLQMMLAAHAELTERYALVYMPTVYEIARLPDRDTELERLARRALSCDIILSQPLFSFGPCNTRQLRDRLSPGQKLLTFSAPDIGGYFPDVCWLSGKTRLRFAPVQDWDSRIIFACYVRGVSIFEVERIYLSHPMFGPRAMLENVAASLERYAKREQGVDIPTGDYVARHYTARRLFHSGMHPADEVLALLRNRTLEALDLPPLPAETPLEVESFGFNRWPVITRAHRLFRFPGQEYFLLANVRHSIEDVAMAYYNFYEFHPHVAEANRHHAEGVL